MKVYRSNRMEILAHELANVLREPSSGGTTMLAQATQKDVVVVQSPGMGRWLEMQLARKIGVCANIDFPFPRAMVRQAVCSVVGQHPKAWSSWQPDQLLWPILESLAERLHEPSFETLANYLVSRKGGDPVAGLGSADGVSLAAEIAQVFDRYLSYRPDTLLQWQEEEGADDWQSQLWRTLGQKKRSPHIASLFAEFQSAIASGVEVDEETLPARICLFGLSTLPPFFLDVFSSLSHIRDVHLFVLCPSNVFWGDIRTQREQARALRQHERQGGTATAEDLHFTEGNPLLASLGRLGRDFQVVLEGLEGSVPYVETEIDLFEEPTETRDQMLQVLQSDVLQLQHRGSLGGDKYETPLDRSDEEIPSVQVHVCHGDLRQVEAIRDNLLMRFNEDTTLQPRDVVVMTPDIERFAPLIEAVFGDEEATPKIPYRIADRTMGKDNPVAEFLVRLLDLAGSRLTVTAVLEVLTLEPVRAHFQISEEDLPEFEEWIRDAGVRWGEDNHHRQHHGQPDELQNTWRFGFDRLLLGAAMQGHGRTSYGGVLPYDEIEGGAAASLGKMIDACETLFRSLRALRTSRSPADWSEHLKATLEQMLTVDDAKLWQLQEVRDVLTGLADQAKDASCTREIELAGMRALLSRRLEQSNRASGFLTGSVTFCALVPMRSIPFRVVVLMGMEDGAFPRKGRNTGFDKTHQSPRRGDRNPREEDRYLVLEALLAARDAFVVTYSGFDPQTGAEQPPATPMDELMGVVNDSFTPPSSWHIKHPLQSFSPRLFRPEAPISHDGRLMSAAKQMLRDPEPRPELYTGPVPQREGDGVLSLVDLVAFYRHPAKAFLYRRMGVYLKTVEDEIEQREPLEISAGLGEWTLKDAALPLRLAGATWEEVGETLRRSGLLPLGHSGTVALEPIQSKIEGLLADAEGLMTGPKRSIPVDLAIGDVRLTGRVSDVYPTGRLALQAGTVSGKYTIDLWIHHLVLRAAQSSARWSSVLVHQKGVVKLGVALTPADATRHLETLVALYQQGQRAPLSFFPKSSWAYFEKLNAKNGSPETALKAAAGVWGGRFSERDAYHQLLYGEQSPCEPGFVLPGDEVLPSMSFVDLTNDIWTPFREERE